MSLKTQFLLLTFMIALGPSSLVLSAEKSDKPDRSSGEKADVPKTNREQAVGPINVFEAAKKKLVEAKLVQQSERSGYLLLRNVSTDSVVVQFPEAFVGVNAIGRGANQQFGGPGTAQSTGISVTAAGQGGRNGDSGLFSIPPKETIRLAVTSVCLEYGKPEPNAQLRYVIMPVEQYSRNPVFQQLLPLFAETRSSQRVAQAAAWHLTNGLKWSELASITNPRAGGLPLPLFSPNDLKLANGLVQKAKARAVEESRKTKAAASKQATGANVQSNATTEATVKGTNRKNPTDQ